jgi:hypothetical protein
MLNFLRRLRAGRQIPARTPMELQRFAAGQRSECCATCALSSLGARSCKMVAVELPEQLDSAACAAWDLSPYHGLAQLRYIQIQAARWGGRYG